MAKAKYEASVTVEDEKITGTVYRDFGDDLSDLVDKYGEQLVFDLAMSTINKKLGSAIRREIKSGTSPEQLQERLESWRPDVKHRVAKNPEEEATQAFLQMTPQQQQEHLAKLREKLAGS